MADALPTAFGSPKSHWYTVEVKIEAFFTINSDGRKSYTKGMTRDWVVDSKRLSLDFILSSLSAEVKWGSYQKSVVWMYDKTTGEDVRVVDNTQILSMAEMCKSEKHVSLLVGMYNKEVADEPLCVIPLEPENFSNAPPGPYWDVPPEAEPACEKTVGNEKPPEQKGQAIFESKAATNVDEEEDLPDIFDFDEEYVGVDEEHIYVPFIAPKVPPTEQHDTPLYHPN